MAVRIYRTQTAGSTTTWTFSAWIKRSTLGTSQQIFAANTGSADPEITCYFNTSDQIDWYNYISGATLGHLKPTRVFRDVGAWYHVVMVWDTTNVTGDDRMQIWVNGVRETVLTTNANPASSQTSQVNTASSVMNIGTNGFSSAKDFNGDMSWVQLVDGAALTPTEFGSVDATSGMWKIKPTVYGTPGTNGFCLKMEDRTNLDLDSSSNAFTFTTTGTGTATYDNPSNNFATFNPLNIPTANLPTYTNGNTTVTTQDAGGSYFGGTSTLGMVAGKWYCEFKVSNAGVASMCGVMGNSQQQARSGQQTGYSTSGYAYMSDGEKKNNASATTYGNSYGTANVIGVALDLDNLKVYFAKDNTWQDSGDPTSGASGTGAAFTVTAPSSTPGGYYTFSCSDNASGWMVWDVNFGNGYFGTTAVTSAEADGAGIGAFEFAPPTGYYALCTKNIKAYGG